MKIFYPDQAGISFRRFLKEGAALNRMNRKYQQLLAANHATETALLHAFRATHHSRERVSTDLGAREFWLKLSAKLDEAETLLQQVADRRLTPFRGRLATIEEVANANDPAKLLGIIAQPKPGPTKRNKRIREMRIWEEAQRNLIIALQLMVIDEMDPRLRVSNDLDAIANLASRRLWHQTMPELWFVSVLDRENEYRVMGGHADPQIFAFRDEDEWRQKRDSLVAAGHAVHVQPEIPVRVAETEEERFVVWMINRRKREHSRLLKIERTGVLKDSRGWKYVVVGVMPKHGGRMRIATREDALRFSEHTRRTLWTSELMEVPDDDMVNPHSDVMYWDVKVGGYYLSPDNGRFIAGRAEQIVTSIGDFISVECSRGSENHVRYAGRRIRDHIAPLWFGHVGIDWKNDPEVRHQLEQAWINSLPKIDDIAS